MTHWTIILLATKAVEETAEGGLFDINATLPLMAIQFLILVALLNVVFYKPLTKAIDERSEYVRSQISQGRERKEKSENLAIQYEQEIREVRKKSQAIIAAAQTEAQKTIAAESQAAQQEALAERQKAAQEIEAQKAEAFGVLEAQVDELSKQILTKLLGPELV
ncbi:MAG: F0F1 ATP synthase subunit B' [Gomphosphaeria aponina SAG 52.96 = DSM 107014]|uniref:ATP synthase subunit b' n=1 Tax=Gomphosphaeria aponina SAG 52.96 = DSM 107014 TaxID=1521640 RepID=A0A941JM76_9CHRO|nr:F0F1 ATP synthase subunit B' [Gomphosphaeria aponina SAG 52.96 = DSM 107014]